jgi:Mn2+/Fe2+ NRAMP family transporter
MADMVNRRITTVAMTLASAVIAGLNLYLIYAAIS